MLLKKSIISILVYLLVQEVVAKDVQQAVGYVPAQPIKRGPPSYPSSSARRAEEGWVDLIFTVGKDAEIKDIEATGHSGVRSFVRPAIKAVSKYKYKPATFNGEPVESLQELRVKFMMYKTPRGADRKFVRNFKLFRDALTAHKVADAHQHLVELRSSKTNNFYESAFLNLAEYYYGLVNQDAAEKQIRRLKAATGIRYGKPYISETAWIDAMGALFILQVEVNDFGGALETFSYIPDNKKFKEARDRLHPAVKQIQDLKSNNKHFATKIRLNRFGFGGVALLKPVFSVSELKGKIENFRMTCDSGIKGLRFVENAEFYVPKSFGECYIHVKGQPNSEFSLVQLPPLDGVTEANRTIDTNDG